MSKPVYTAYIDESGQRSRNGSSSPHFIMSALVVPQRKEDAAQDFLAELRTALRRRPGQILHWSKYTAHTDRLRASSDMGQRHDLFRISSVVVCKDHLPKPGEGFDQDAAYLYTFRFLLERLSWLVKERGGELHYVLGHVVRFQKEKLREYERRLRSLPSADCKIAWDHVNPKGGQIDQPSRVELLQLADIAASATAIAFNPDDNGFTEDRYLRNLLPILYRRNGGALTTYGLKMHPWNNNTKAAYPWVAAL
ncbi:DUF3800 domain-containing protein [Rhodococcus ruber]|uniref:DUF3800 domain-containing protein n=1 Tax=Rhodococcus ruber TaxID=1830 RepID=UPI0013C4BD2D|nr:DUF3800 domain-containing protein [Rhodococcus ruber]UQB74702.1 DUF3800 domain-containing protein [Rhodococcus ruber]